MTLSHISFAVAVAAAIFSPPVSAQASKVIPAANASVEGSRQSVYPFGYTNPRVQQVWAGSAITSSVAFIDGLDYRGNAPRSATQAMPARAYTGLQIDFGPTSVSPTTLSKTFASNITSTMTTVFNAAFNLPAQPALATSPSPFNIKFSWTTPVMFSSANGNLLVETTIPGPRGKSNYFIDAEVSTGGGGGTISPFGTSGPFSRPESVKLSANPGTLTPGGTLSLTCAPFKNSYTGNLMISLSNTMWGSVPLPLDLALIGAPNNSLYVGMDIVLPFNTTPATTGHSSNLTAPIPNQSPYYGLRLYTQAYYLDAQANSAGLVTTHGLGLTIASSSGPVTNTVGHFDYNATTGNFGHGSLYGGPVVQFRGILP